MLYRTDTQYEDSMIVKIFIFLFINSYASFYYLAFIAEIVNDCPPQGCMYTLAINVCVVFGSTLCSSMFMQLVYPYVSYHYRYYCLQRGHNKQTRRDRADSTYRAEYHPDDIDVSSDTSHHRESSQAYQLSRPEKEHMLVQVEIFRRARVMFMYAFYNIHASLFGLVKSIDDGPRIL